MRASLMSVVVGVVLAGCAAGLLGPPGIPVAWSDVGLVETDAEAGADALGFTLSNLSETQISRVELRFVLGGDVYEGSADGPIEPGDAARFELPLDDVPVAAREAPLERFHARVVTFADGSRWLNPGIHLAPAGAHESPEQRVR